MRSFARALAEFVILALGSAIVGWAVGTLQYYAIDLWAQIAGTRPWIEPSLLRLAYGEGGTVGIVFAIPTGLLCWYLVLQRHATMAEVSTVVFWSLIGGCLAGACLGIVSAFLTPLLTLSVSGFVIVRRWRKEQPDPVNPPETDSAP